jgi:hypothetical protein
VSDAGSGSGVSGGEIGVVGMGGSFLVDFVGVWHPCILLIGAAKVTQHSYLSYRRRSGWDSNFEGGVVGDCWLLNRYQVFMEKK